MKNLLSFASVLLVCGIIMWSCEKDQQLTPTNGNATFLDKNGSTIDLPTLNTDGILVFNDVKHLDAVVAYLEKEQDEDEGYSSEYDNDCMKEDKALDVFEQNFSTFTSLRTHYLEIECQELAQNVAIEDLTMCPIPDDIQATLLNKHGEVIVGDEVYLFKANSLRYKTEIENINEIKNFRNGGVGNYGVLDIDGLPKGPNGGPESGVCDVLYTPSINRPNSEVAITWQGTTSLNHQVKYEWGDGTETIKHTINNGGASTTHVYPSPGQYTITITLFNETPGEECASAAYEDVNLNQICGVHIKAEGGTNGIYTFNPIDLLLANNATVQEWHWNFGDGTPTEVIQGGSGTVTHEYACESDYLVTLQVISSEPTCQPQAQKTISVTNVVCVDRDYDSNWSTEPYDNDTKRLKHRTWLSNALWPSNLNNERVKAKMKSYKTMSGNKKLKKPLKIVFGGHIYASGSGDCFGDQPINLVGQELKTKKTLKHVINKQETIGTKSTDAYTVEYYIDGVLIFTKQTDDAGC